jgi:hypothetical protein
MLPVDELSDEQLTYFRHARFETLRAIGVDPVAATLEPLPLGVYVFAEDDFGGAIGMAEASFIQPEFETYKELPFGDQFDLERICPVETMARLRTIYVEPTHRKTRALFPQMCMCMAYVFTGLGARFTIATTNACDDRLALLYSKLGGERLSTLRMDGFGEVPLTLYLLDLGALLRHRARDRLLSGLAVHRAISAMQAGSKQ